MAERTLQLISAAAARPLRQTVLRSSLPASENVYPADDDDSSIHVGVLVADELVAIGSAFNEPQEVHGAATDWRVRGMAVLKSHRGTGLGADVLSGLLNEIGARGGRFVWANARTGVVGFYAKHGFSKQGNEFELPGIGPHFVVVTKLPGQENR